MNVMTLTQLRAFVAVATTGSVRAAAERLFVSQPAVSAACARCRSSGSATRCCSSDHPHLARPVGRELDEGALEE